MKTKTIYIAKDWTEFETEEECKKHDKCATPNKIIHKTYIHGKKWLVYKELQEDWYEFDEEIQWILKYILNEVQVTLEIDTKTGEYTILSFS